MNREDVLNKFMKLEQVDGLTLADVKGTEEKLTISVQNASFYDLYDRFDEHCEDFKICNSLNGEMWIVYDVIRKKVKKDE